MACSPDTLTVHTPGHVYRIRLHGIDSLELRQPGGAEARSFTTDTALDRTVRVTEIANDKYGRMVAVITLADGRVLNHAVLRSGNGWWYAKYSPGETDLQAIEAEARAAKRGLWGSADPVPPWEWRKARFPVTQVPVRQRRSLPRSGTPVAGAVNRRLCQRGTRNQR